MTPENKQISINGKFISGYKHITLSQKINDHHSFEVGIDLEAGETTTAHTIDKSKDWLGKTILITTTGKDFTGIITNISLNQNNGNHGQIILSGYSSTILLEDSEFMQSWLNKSLADIIKDTTNNPKVSVTIAPEHSGTIEYQSQYLETNFKFVQRIAKQYNEWLYYDGDTLFFGKPTLPDAITVEYGKDLTEMNVGIQTQARKIQGFSFNSQDVQQFTSQSPDSPAGLNELGQHAFNTSLETFSRGGNAYTSARVQNKSDIDTYLKKKQQSASADSNYISGKSTKRGLSVGSVIDIETAVLSGVASYATKKHGKYIITEITHHAKEANYYTNSFVALPVDIKSLPEPKVTLPVAQTQMATVLSNQDPKNKGRVQVQMNWQSGEMKTAWIRVMTPDAGASDNIPTNRGFVFIPEEGDQVLLGFRYNDPNRPFVLGSLFNGQTGAGGRPTNTHKSIITRSGHTLEFNDKGNAESITITDKKGNHFIIDTANETITINALKDININAGENLNITAGKNITVNAGENIDENAGQNITTVAGTNISQIAGADFTKKSTNMSEDIDENMNVSAKLSQDIVGQLDLASTVENLNFNSAKEVKSNTKEQSNFQ